MTSHGSPRIGLPSACTRMRNTHPLVTMFQPCSETNLSTSVVAFVPRIVGGGIWSHATPNEECIQVDSKIGRNIVSMLVEARKFVASELTDSAVLASESRRRKSLNCC